MSAGTRLGLALVWLVLLVLTGWAVSRQLDMTGDLRKFMPAPQTPAQKLLIGELGEGPASRLLLLAIDGGVADVDTETLAAQSAALRDALARDPQFALVANGSDAGLAAIPQRLRPYRYLLSPTLDRQRFDREYLDAQLAARVQDLGSPAAGLIEPLLASDPTLETLKLAEAWRPEDAPQRLHGVWFSDGDAKASRTTASKPSPSRGGLGGDGVELRQSAQQQHPTHPHPSLPLEGAGANAPRPRLFGVPAGHADDRDSPRALLIAQTRAGGFDPAGQQAAIDAIRAAFARVRGDSRTQLILGGPGAFSVAIGNRTRREAGLIGSIDSLIFVLLLALAYRSWKAPLLGALPLASGGLAGLGAVALGFDGVHGITVAFGFTLIGVAQDYPIHLFSHQRPGLSPWASVRALWPTLGTGVVSTCIAYLTFLVSGVDGLEQLAVFTIVGLAVAALATRFALPGLIDPAPRDVAASPGLARCWTRLAGWPRINTSVLAGVAALALAVVVFAPGRFWENDLSKLTPAPPELLARDAQLRGELGAPDLRYLIALRGDSVEAVLRQSEALRPALQQLRRDDVIAGFDMAARYLPSMRTQRARQARLPDRETLQATLGAAVADSPFRAGAFAAFVDDVARARAAPPLTIADLTGTPLAVRVDGLLVRPALAGNGRGTDPHPSAGGAIALVSLGGLADPAAVAHVARAHGARLLDLKQASESLVAQYRGRVLWALLLAAGLLAATVAVALRSARRTLRVLAPMALSTLLVLAVLRGFGVELNLFHLVALILAAGLGLDYALFFDHAGDDRADQLRTLHAVIVCSLTTLLVFSLLALSSIPVLRAIGVPVALGVAFNFVLSLLLVRQPTAMETADARA